MAETSGHSLRRASNEGRRLLFGATRQLIAFVCECGRLECSATVLLSPAEYDARRPNPITIETHAD